MNFIVIATALYGATQLIQTILDAIKTTQNINDEELEKAYQALQPQMVDAISTWSDPHIHEGPPNLVYGGSPSENHPVEGIVPPKYHTIP